MGGAGAAAGHCLHCRATQRFLPPTPQAAPPLSPPRERLPSPPPPLKECLPSPPPPPHHTLSAASSVSAVTRTCSSSSSPGSGLPPSFRRPSLTLPLPRMAILVPDSCSMRFWVFPLCAHGGGGAWDRELCLHMHPMVMFPSLPVSTSSTLQPCTTPSRNNNTPRADNEANEVVLRMLVLRDSEPPVLLLRPVVRGRLVVRVLLDQLRDDGLR